MRNISLCIFQISQWNNNFLFILFIYTVPFTHSCLPTQSTEAPTTTTETPYPCSVCPKIYSPGCLGGDICASIAEVGLKYTLGLLPGYNYGDANTCSTIFSCPIGTTSRVRELLTGLIVPGPPLVIATCSETGANAGTWYLGIPPLVTPIEIVATSCLGVI
ncbi:unnamed protein product [Caenorhabditis angaria]|uniref:Uncharacterized protein n=1 Tax=Caenorhabditis angaria TaxID=860376 RepID=A0A9P1J3H0_9PELO|nr:unnamed protein product [Caenorhabditis angaria]